MKQQVKLMVLLALSSCRDEAGHADAETGAAADSSTGTPGTGTTSGDPTAADSGSTGSDTGGEIAVVPAPGGLRRLRADQYIGTVDVLLGGHAAAAASPPPDQSLLGFDSIGGSTVPMSPAMVEQYERSALDIGDAVIEEPYTLAQLVPCVDVGPKDEGCYVQVAQVFGRAAWRRPITVDEDRALVDVARVAREFGGDRFELGLKYQIAMILESPAFLYAAELGEVGDDGRRRLTTDEWVTRTALFVLGRAPSAQTFVRLDAGEFDGPEAPRALAQEWLNQSAARTAVGGFFDELLRVRDVVDSSKDPTIYPLYSHELSTSMRTESLMLVDDVVFGDGGGDIRRLFDADYTFADPLLAQVYGVTVDGDGFSRIELPAAQDRLGILSHPSLLSVGAHYDRNSPTRRGLFIQRQLLCNDVPPPPPNVDTNLPEPVEQTTLRERLEGHLAQGGACVGCHAQTDPLGFAFEFYDATGVRRELDNGYPIDASGEVDGLGSFVGAAELAVLVRDDPRLAACMVRNLYRHAIGRQEDEGTAELLASLSDRFTAAEFDFPGLIVDLVDNPGFLEITDPQ